jgi:hypothetical protein
MNIVNRLKGYIDWYKYLLSKPTYDYYSIYWDEDDWRTVLKKLKEGIIYRLIVVNCRRLGHPHGPIYYTSSRMEPDMRCTICGDDLG